MNSSSKTPFKLIKKKIINTFPNLSKGEEANLNNVAELIKEGKVKNVIIMAGAGISTAAGIPDFRSPETGLYSNLEKYQLPYPEAIFDIAYFVEKPQAFYTLAKELYPGNFKPTLTHYFFRLLKDKGLLSAVFTQNIDTLERIAGLDEDSVIEAHGSFAEAACLRCKHTYTKESIKPQIELGEVVRCQRTGCSGKSAALIKPKIVFFGEALPERFHDRISDFETCDLLIVLGTSLSVQPFASLIDRVPSNCPRLLINMETVGETSPRRSTLFPSTSRRNQNQKAGKRPSASSPSAEDYSYSSLEEEENDDEDEEISDGFDFDGRTKRRRGIRDVRYLGSSDEGIDKLSSLLGWSEELNELFRLEHERLDEESKLEKQGEREAEVEVKVEVLEVEIVEVKLVETKAVELVPGNKLEDLIGRLTLEATAKPNALL